MLVDERPDGIDEALALVLARVRPLPLVDVPIRDAAGRVLGEDARAATDLPPFDSSAMDGYAVRAGTPRGRCGWWAIPQPGVPSSGLSGRARRS